MGVVPVKVAMATSMAAMVAMVVVEVAAAVVAVTVAVVAVTVVRSECGVLVRTRGMAGSADLERQKGIHTHLPQRPYTLRVEPVEACVTTDIETGGQRLYPRAAAAPRLVVVGHQRLDYGTSPARPAHAAQQPTEPSRVACATPATGGVVAELFEVRLQQALRVE